MTSSLQLVFGPMLIGVFLNVTLWGIMAVQTMVYYQAYKNLGSNRCMFSQGYCDSQILYLVTAETLNSALDMAMMYELLVAQFGSQEATTFFPKLLAAGMPVSTTVDQDNAFDFLVCPLDPILTVLISTPIQVFIAYRIRVISQGGGLWTASMVIFVRVFARKPELHTPALTWLLASAIADVTITASLYWSLNQRKTGFKHTDDSINRILRLTVQTGLITAIVALLDVICFLALPHTTINFIWDFALSKLYTNALMSTLNARAGWNSLAGVDPYNVLFGMEITSASQINFQSHSRLEGFGWGSTYRTNPELAFTGISRVETDAHDCNETLSRDRTRHADLPTREPAALNLPKNPILDATQLEAVEYGVAITDSKEVVGPDKSRSRTLSKSPPATEHPGRTLPILSAPLGPSSTG
ncbi:hypothetical protein V5O48_008094 [Marasmius crinis-equi]|uniref:DUF6534 domain-containing protein n=1 Tax=Marasmius crinis-equi TaxID=585013 RepID=A0ABR3FFL3_9AGAR